MLRCLVLFAAVPLVGQTLTPALMRWRQEIEARGTPVYITRVDYNPARNTIGLPQDAPRRDIFASYLRSPAFLNDFQHLYAASITHKEEGKESYLILLNTARADEWRDAEEAVLAHELGHHWLQSLGYPAPAYQPGPLSCVSMFAGDVVQHVLIRQELDRREINHRGLMARVLDATARHLAANPKPPASDRCLLVRQAAQLADAILGMSGAPWPGREAYDAAWREKLPDIEVPVGKIVRYLRNRDVAPLDAHKEAVQFAYEQLLALYLSSITGEVVREPAPSVPPKKQ
jgi:hypothetical protein